MNPWAAIVGKGDPRRRAAAHVVRALREAGLTVGGVVQDPILDGEQCLGYDLVDLLTGERVPLARVDPAPELCDYAFDSAAFEQARRWALARCDAVFFEAGKLERAGGGHWPAVLASLDGPPRLVVVCIKPTVAAPVVLSLPQPCAGIEVPTADGTMASFVADLVGSWRQVAS